MNSKLAVATLSSLLLLSACGGSEEKEGDENPSPQESQTQETYEVEADFYGEWVSIGSTASITLDAETRGTLTVSDADPNIIHFQYRNKTTSGTYIRKWPRTSKVIGSIAELETEESSTDFEAAGSGLYAIKSSGLSGVA